MSYFIEFTDNRKPIFAHSRNELLKQVLPKLRKDEIKDIRRLRISGGSETVLDIYQERIDKICR